MCPQCGCDEVERDVDCFDNINIYFACGASFTVNNGVVIYHPSLECRDVLLKKENE